MAKRVVYTDKALADIDRIVEFNNLRNRSDAYSKKFVPELRKRLIELSKHPLSGIKTNDPGTFLLIWNSYYIFYEDYDGSIEITGIYHQKENISR
jgi:plasmid stabilization system protein ParE